MSIVKSMNLMKTRSTSCRLLPALFFCLALAFLVVTYAYIAKDFEELLTIGVTSNEQSIRVETKKRNYNITLDDVVKSSKDEERCDLLPHGKGPTPVILLSLGRSGSTIVWSTLSELTGSRNTAWEFTGGNLNSSKAFFDKIEEDPKYGYDWPIMRLCRIQQYSTSKNWTAITTEGKRFPRIIGFQWKPYWKSWNHEYAIEGLKEIGSHRNPTIKVIYLRRNPLDRKASNLRHENSKKRGSKISAHCSIGDENCIKEHSKFDDNIIFPQGQELLNWLRVTEMHDNAVAERLEELNIKFVEVSYEKLFNTNNAEEWMRIFRYLGKGPSKELTMEKVRASFSTASTHTKRHRNETITNFDEVEATLAGTSFEHYLN